MCGIIKIGDDEMNKIENVILLLLSITFSITAIIFTHEYIIIQKDYLMLIPVVIFAVLATFTLIFFLLCVIRGKIEYQLVDNKILVKRRKKLIFTIDVIKIDGKEYSFIITKTEILEK